MANTSLPVALLLDLSHPGRRGGDWEVRSSTLRAMLRSGTIGSHILKNIRVVRVFWSRIWMDRCH